MKENMTLEGLYEKSNIHKFGDISLIIENKAGKLRGKFVFHPFEIDKKIVRKNLSKNGLPECFSKPPILLDSDVTSKLIWDEKYRTLKDIIPEIENEVDEFGKVMDEMSDKLILCANCKFFEKCYRIAEFNLKKKESGEKRINEKWSF